LAIVDQQRQGDSFRRQPHARVPDRIGEGGNYQRGKEKSQQGKPPWALLRSFFSLQHAREYWQGWKNLGLGFGQGQPQQPPDHRQREQSPQHHGGAEGERQPTHGQAFPSARPPPSVNARCSLTKASEARRSV